MASHSKTRKGKTVKKKTQHCSHKNEQPAVNTIHYYLLQEEQNSHTFLRPSAPMRDLSELIKCIPYLCNPKEFKNSKLPFALEFKNWIYLVYGGGESHRNEGHSDCNSFHEEASAEHCAGWLSWCGWVYVLAMAGVQNFKVMCAFVDSMGKYGAGL